MNTPRWMLSRKSLLQTLNVVCACAWLSGVAVMGQEQPPSTDVPPPTPSSPEEAKKQAEALAKAKEDAAKAMAEAQQRIKKLAPGEYELDGIHIHAGTREIRVPTVVNLKKAPIEYALVHETGKTHESILATAIQPTSIQVALLLANYQPGTEGILTKVPEAERPKWKEEAPAKPQGNRVQLKVEWKVGAETKTAALSEWVQNSDKRIAPPDLGTWIFNGSRIDDRGFTAQAEGSIIAVWIDRNALINSPAEGNWRDDLWISMADKVPEEGTPVTLIITPETTPAPATPPTTTKP